MDGSEVPAQPPAPRESESDAELAARFEREAFALLDPLFRGALGLTGDPLEAENLLERAMLNAYRQFRSFPENTNLRASLYRLLTNAYIGSCRARHHRPAECRNKTTIDWQLATAGRHPSSGLSLADVEALETLPPAVITKALQALRLDTRMVVYYADVEHFSYGEIAHITNRSVDAVKSLLGRGRHQLRHVLLAAYHEQAAHQFAEDPPKDVAGPPCAPPHRSSEADPCAAQLDWFDREIVRFVLLWAPHGVMWDEDVYPAFGMTAKQLVDRFHRIVDTFVPRRDCLAKSDREMLDKACHLTRVFGQAR